MPIQLSKNRVFIPDLFLTFVDDETGETKRINNRDLPASQQIRAEITLAGAGDKVRYIDRVNETDIKTQKISIVDKLDFNQAVVDHCHLIEGLEAEGIKTGAQLVKFSPTRETNDLIVEIFHKVCGTHVEDTDIPTTEKSTASA